MLNFVLLVFLIIGSLGYSSEFGELVKGPGYHSGPGTPTPDEDLIHRNLRLTSPKQIENICQEFYGDNAALKRRCRNSFFRRNHGDIPYFNCAMEYCRHMVQRSGVGTEEGENVFGRCRGYIENRQMDCAETHKCYMLFAYDRESSFACLDNLRRRSPKIDDLWEIPLPPSPPRRSPIVLP